jgi:hypothetical protein
MKNDVHVQWTAAIGSSRRAIEVTKFQIVEMALVVVDGNDAQLIT